MSDIDAVIARSRAKRGFKKKGYFTLAREKAKRKVSEYALPARHYYCLEFLQAAVALGAKYVDVSSSNGRFVLSFVGGNFDRHDLEYLFDFLLVTKYDNHFRARRRLAIGIASALSDGSTSVVLETGDGTAENSLRMELETIEGSAIVGNSQDPIEGTFIKIQQRNLSYYPTMELTPETLLIEERCLDYPIPLLLNGQMLTGYSANKGLLLRQFMHPVSFDEGDFYGGVAYDAANPDEFAELKILTNGIWITTLNGLFLPPGISGVIGYERLNKTASQYDIARDKRISEMVERLKPHVDQVLRKLHVPDEERLKYLFNRKPQDVKKQGSPYVCKFQLPLGDEGANCQLRLWKSHEETSCLNLLVIHGIWNKRIDHVRITFPIPLSGELLVDNLSLDDIIFRQPEVDSWYLYLNSIGLKEDIYLSIMREIGAKRIEIESKLEAQKEEESNISSDVRDALSEIINAPPENKQGTRAQNLNADGQTFSREKSVPSSELEPRQSENCLPNNDTSAALDNIEGMLETEQRAALGKKQIAALEEKIARLPRKTIEKRKPRRARPLPDPDQIKRFLGKTSRPREEILIDLLTRVLDHARLENLILEPYPVGESSVMSKRIWWDGKIKLENLDPHDPMAVAQPVSNDHDLASNDAQVFSISINSANPKAHLLLKNADKNPAGLYLLALAAIDGIRAVTDESELNDHELLFHTKLLNAIEKNTQALEHRG